MPGPDIIYKCPKCGSFLKNKSLMSGNTIGACHYSDGKVIAMMMPEYPYITICEKCNAIFWLEEECEVGTCNAWDESDIQYANVSYANFLSIEEYFKALQIDGIIRKKKDEFYIRQRIWWKFNDRIRFKGKDKQQFINDDDRISWKSNLERILEILDKKDINHLIMSAEIYRNFGDFEKCISIIRSIAEPGFENIKDAFVKACNDRNTKVFRFKEYK